MKLKELSLVGFKSFKDRTKLEFEDGITAIVGPNGCGKSNVVDALFWVLGDQSPKHLRTQHMSEVIFAGTHVHKASGFCEVSMALSREGLTVPTEYDDESLDKVTVTRRLYVDGESEYFINGNRCRLKDVVALFLDSGLVGSSYAIIQQGVISQMIQSKPADRSLLIQEVAGLTKYKVKKDEAQRKMSLTKTHCTRIQDLIGELEGQQISLKEQAESAKRYKELDTKVKDLHTRYRGLEVYLLEKDVGEKSTSLAQVQDEMTSSLTALNNAQASLEKCNQELRHRDENLRAQRHQLDQLTQNVESMRLEVNNLYHSKDRLDLLLKQSKQDEERIEIQKKDALRRADVDQKKLQATTQEFETFITENASLVERYESGRVQEAQVEKALSETKSALQSAEDEYTQSSLELHRAISKLESEFGAYEKDKEQATRIQEKLDVAQKEYLELEVILQNKQALLSTHRSDMDAAQARIQQKQDAIEQDNARKNKLEHEIEGHVLKADQIRAWIRTQGAPQDNFEVPEDVVPMVDGVCIPQDQHEAATRFLHFYQNIWTCKNRESLKQLAAAMPQDRTRGMMVALSSGSQGVSANTPTSDSTCMNQTGLNQTGLNQTWLSSYGAVKVWESLWPEKNTMGVLSKPLYEVDHVDHLLDIVENQSPPLPCHFRSKDGTILFDDGMIYFPPTREDESDLFYHKDQERSLLTHIEKLKVEWGLIDARLSQHTQQLIEFKQEVATLRESFVGIEEDVSTARTRLHQRSVELDHLKKLDQDMKSSLENTTASIIDLRKRYTSCLQSSETLSAQIDRLKQERTQQETSRENIREENIRLKTGYEIYESTKAERESTIQRLQEEVQRFKLQLEDLASQTQLLLLNRSQYEEDRVTTEQKHGEATDRCAELENEHATLKQTVESLQKQYEAQVDQRESVLGETRKLEKDMAELDQRKFQLTSAVEAAMLSLSELRTEPVQPLSDELRALSEDEKKTVLNKTKREYTSGKKELDSLGDVNLLAIHQYEEVCDRLEFLTQQRDDLLSSLHNLEATINEIQTSVRQTFMETFEKVNELFKKYFPILFRGGEGYLSLNEDMADQDLPGVEIHAAPPGKKMKHNALLSGGEKALVALGLVISLYEVKPSPFLVLDEVDSPFDEANVESFIDICRHISKLSQVIMITHNKKTMQSADTLYGVTLKEKGISQVVSVRLVHGHASI